MADARAHAVSGSQIETAILPSPPGGTYAASPIQNDPIVLAIARIIASAISGIAVATTRMSL